MPTTFSPYSGVKVVFQAGFQPDRAIINATINQA
jgi:hypothetical protein